MKAAPDQATSRKAFTLLELLIAVAIIGVLMALLFAGGKSMMNSAYGAGCANNMRQLSSALFTYQGENNGWFPPGRPVPYMDLSTINFKNYLVPTYLSEMPACPGMRLTSEGVKSYPNWRQRIRDIGGGYKINALFLQWKPTAFPPPVSWPANRPFVASKTVFMMEGVQGSATWSLQHVDTALSGGGIYRGRNHGGREDMLNFMFYDGHIERIGRNAPPDTSDNDLSNGRMWRRESNPKAVFSDSGNNGTYIRHNGISQSNFEALYP